jgi:ubiquinone/menaquinone biosynthesis C-methylase UbiE
VETAIRPNRSRSARLGFKSIRIIVKGVPLIRGAPWTRRFFDRLASRYDRINAKLYRPEWRTKVRSALRGKVLDVGVGTGFTTEHLADAVGLDLSSEMLRRARYAGHLVRGNFLRPPFRADRFDTIVFAGSFYYLDDPLQAMRTSHALLKPGGRLVILSPASRWFAAIVSVYSERDYRELSTAAGLVLESYDRLNWAACLVIARKS